ncbi:WXG100 family type VII secretion target [Pseudonocardia xinjiangensis]|jgi:WXG100 family type VII secretion target|uniref:WXG100 family type VII secretion target n=1 Tax=Pseudonocardia xinjiangensis TaxID=75289 RepID=A0ABX1RQI6_9PSEU|nr:WXG100 family type VII secretion target [Pseudonocardia xinjiangensis]NMH81899.1 WXG100 family type VII secretion target [Pseudonocardia xinjiangensis]
MATHDPVNVDTAAMRNGANLIESGATNVASIGTGVQQNIDSLMRTWTGESAKGFAGAMNEFYQQTGDIAKMLNTLAGFVNKSAADYDRAHGATVDDATQLRQKLTAQAAQAHTVRPGLRGF